jgi:PST family polysaccharide transporter
LRGVIHIELPKQFNVETVQASSLPAKQGRTGRPKAFNVNNPEQAKGAVRGADKRTLQPELRSSSTSPFQGIQGKVPLHGREIKLACMSIRKANNPYTDIVKSTSLFGFVQVFNIIVKVGINKAVAVILGTAGMGIIGLLQSTISIFQTVFDFGLSQSMVRDISVTKNTSETVFNRTVSISKKLIFIMALLGALATLMLSPCLSYWTFGNRDYTGAFIWLSIVVFLNIISGGQLAILKGMRMLRMLAKASLFGSVTGLITGVPLYFFLKEKGIVPSLIAASLTAFAYSWHYTRKVNYTKQSVSIKNTFREGKPMLKMGLALMYVSFLGALGDYLLRAFISHTSSTEMVGLFQAGATVVSGYFGIVFTALSTDYYPRISAINSDNAKLSEEFNRQSEVSLLLVGPLVVLFTFSMDFFVRLLYSKEFMPITGYLEYAVLGNLLIVVSNAFGMILLAKQAVRVFFYTVTLGKAIILSAMILLFYYYRLEGLGLAVLFTGIFHLAFMQAVLWKLYKIKIRKGLIRILAMTCILCGLSFFLRRTFEHTWTDCCAGAALIAATAWFSLHTAKLRMKIDFIQIIKQKIKRR